MVRGYTRRVGFYGRYNKPGTGRKSQELKFYDSHHHNLGISAATNGGTPINVTGIEQGTGESQRLGRKVVLRSIEFHLTFHWQPGQVAAVAYNRIRMLVLVDKQTNGAIFQHSDIFETNEMDAFYNLVNQGRFRIMKDSIYNFNVRAQMPSDVNVIPNEFVPAQVTKTMRIKKRLNLPIEYSGTSGARSEIRSNNIYLFVIKEFTTTNFNVEFHSRVRYDG